MLAAICLTPHDYPMAISSKDRETTMLPTPCPTTVARGSFHPLELKPLCPQRMAAAEAADDVVVAMCEEISQLMQKPRSAAKAKPATRGNSARASVRARPRRKAQ